MVSLFNSFRSEIEDFRRQLHQSAELSGHEIITSGIIKDFLSNYNPDAIYAITGGYGLLARYDGDAPGRSVLLRSEMDALPISERISVSFRSRNPLVSHSCGHDGHCAILASVGAYLYSNRPEKGTVFLLFQPSEENGSGAESVLNDRNIIDLGFDYVFALHNLPGFPLGSVILRENLFSLSSVGLEIQLTGLSSHASEPEKGRNPAFLMAELINQFSKNSGFLNEFSDEAVITVIHFKLGEESFGTNPGMGKILVTIRSGSDLELKAICEKCEVITAKTAINSGIDISFNYHDKFPATMNSSDAVKIVETAAQRCKMEVIKVDSAFPWSEDFGHFTAKYPGVLFGIGAGEDHPPLHNPDYDFPEELLAKGFELYRNIINESLK